MLWYWVIEYLKWFEQVIGIIPTLSFLRGESFPTEIRATACGYVVALGKIILVVNHKLFPIAITLFGFRNVVYFYALMMALMVIWGCLTIKDTEHLSLSEIHDNGRNDELWNDEEEETETEDEIDTKALLKVYSTQGHHRRVTAESIGLWYDWICKYGVFQPYRNFLEPAYF